MTRAPLEETETQENKQESAEEKMCAAPGAEVKIVRMTRGRRMTDEAFAALSEKDKVRVLRNRRNALQTRARRQSRIATLKRDNALLEASIALKEQQVAVLMELLGEDTAVAKTVEEESTPVVVAA